MTQISDAPTHGGAAQRPAFLEFVSIIALMMGVTAFATDNLLPALDVIRAEFRVANPNHLQLLVYGYMIVFAVAQLFWGPLSDIVGRRPVLLAGLAIFMAGCVLSVLAWRFDVLLLSRVIQGLGAAAGRVLAVTIVRDRYAGREMARVMSLAMLVFLMVPVFAPAIGTVLVSVGSWHSVFASSLAVAVLLALWFGLRMPETLHPEYRFPFSVARIAKALRLTATTRVSIGYATAVGLMFGCLMAYIGSSQQILETSVYGLGPLFSFYFALVAITMGAGSLLNSQLVRRLGMRRLSHAGVCGFLFLATLQVAAALAYGGKPPLALFMTLLSASFFLFSLTVPNFNALAMQPLGAIAGTASSFIGAYTTLLGAVFGLLVGQSFNGTVIPFGIGFFALSLGCLAVVLWTERGSLFRGSQQPHG
jgi:DHA1 family bicyclomycin/chloramphenicol resistance-like MFS transporter